MKQIKTTTKNSLINELVRKLYEKKFKIVRKNLLNTEASHSMAKSNIHNDNIKKTIKRIFQITQNADSLTQQQTNQKKLAK